MPRETPRSPFFLGLRAEMLDELACEIKLDVSSRDGGPAAVEFSLPEGAALSQGSAFEDSVLEAGETREYRVVVQMPPEGHHFIAAYATVGGRRGEAFVELGERASAQARGLRIRQRDEGQRVIRIGGEETRK